MSEEIKLFKDKPILFSAPMIRAVLDGKKTQTRRIVKPMSKSQAEWLNQDAMKKCSGFEAREHHGRFGVQFFHPMAGKVVQGVHVGERSPFGYIECPYGKPGDRLWVRENWRVGAWRNPEVIGGEDRGAALIHQKVAVDYQASPELDRTPWLFPEMEVFRKLRKQGIEDCEKEYATNKGRIIKTGVAEYKWDHGKSPCRWRPSIHMPRWASRITLEIKNIRVEPLREISEADCIAEGCTGTEGDLTHYLQGQSTAPSPRAHFMNLWQSINGQGSWEQNPLVWVVEFEKVQQ